MEAFVVQREDERRVRRESRKPPPLGNSWAKELNGRERKRKKDLRYWGVGGVEGVGERGARREKKGMEKALRGLEDPFKGF